MKKIVSIILAATVFISCSGSPKTKLKAVENIKGVVFGDSIQNENIMDLSSLSTAMGKESELEVKVKGKIDSVCVGKVCLLTMKLSNGQDMLVTFSDSVVVVPQSVTGKEVIIDGQAYLDTLSVENLQDEARKSGKSKAEISAITTPKLRLLYEAKGLVVLN